MTLHKGGCACGAVRFEVQGEPIVSGACYCRTCQYVAGGGAAYGMMFRKEALKVTKGEMKCFTVKGDSGADVFRFFCPGCGVHLISYNSNGPEFRAVKAGVLDDPSWFQSQGSIWTSDAQPWHQFDQGLPIIEKNPSELPV